MYVFANQRTHSLLITYKNNLCAQGMPLLAVKNMQHWYKRRRVSLNSELERRKRTTFKTKRSAQDIRVSFSLADTWRITNPGERCFVRAIGRDHFLLMVIEICRTAEPVFLLQLHTECDRFHESTTSKLRTSESSLLLTTSAAPEGDKPRRRMLIIHPQKRRRFLRSSSIKICQRGKIREDSSHNHKFRAAFWKIWKPQVY